MAFTAGSVAVPASGGTPVLVYQTPGGVPTNVTLYLNGTSCWVLESATQTPSDGYPLVGTTPFTVLGLVGSIYAAGADAVARTISYVASNVI